MKKNYPGKIKLLAFLLQTCFVCITMAQHSGNIVYRDTEYYDQVFNNRSVQKFYISDTDMQISVSVLLNQKPDKYVVTLGVNQEAKTPKLALAGVNARISKFISQLKQYGVNKENIFVDFISQTKVYDFDKVATEKNSYEQLEKGFEIKKNVIIQLSRNDQIEQIISEASESEIYDIVKVEYLNNDMEAIYAKLLDEAKMIGEKKQMNYIQKFSPRIVGLPSASDRFYYSFPKDQYKQYEAAESSSLVNYGYNDYNVRKIARKNHTSYYDGLNYSGFDKVINNGDPEPCIQYVLTLNVRYALQKSL